MSNSNIVQRTLYLSLPTLFEFPINGLIGRQHDKHLNAHVEDGHGDQVRHVVPEDRRNYIYRPSRVLFHSEQIYREMKRSHDHNIAFIYL